MTVTSILPPLAEQRRLRAIKTISRLAHQLQHCHSRARLTSDRLAKPFLGGCRTLWTASIQIIWSSSSPGFLTLSATFTTIF
jgi:hypothetical protein